MKLIVAVDERWGIGRDGDLLLSIPEDMRFFREMTRDGVLVMGYNTLLSFPKGRPLPGRLNIVLNDAPDCSVSGAVVCDSMEQLFRLIGGFHGEDVFVIGGGSIYRQLLPYCDTAYITKMCFDGDADTFIPDLDALPGWSVVSESEMREHEGIGYSFVTYHNSAADLPVFRATDGNMAAYFKKKDVLCLNLIEGAGAPYAAALQSLLYAFDRPLYGGCTAADVSRFLDSGEPSLERYWRRFGYIAAQEDFAALERQFNPDNAQRTYPVFLDRERRAAFAQALSTASVEQLVRDFSE